MLAVPPARLERLTSPLRSLGERRNGTPTLLRERVAALRNRRAILGSAAARGRERDYRPAAQTDVVAAPVNRNSLDP